MTSPNRQAGLIRFLVLVIALIVILAYFGVDVRGWFDQPGGAGTLSYWLAVGKSILGDLGRLFGEFYDSIFIPYIQEPILHFWGKI